jgi:D-glycero-D-manno-heptose 1,7-bisphosphate phosphatase
MTASPPLRAVFLDRDGVLNVDHGYVSDPAALDWITGAREAVAALTAAGVVVLVVTNQSGVGRGYFDVAAMDHFHAAMQADLAKLGGRIDTFYACFHHVDAALEEYRHPDHPDRKPNPGMILRGLEAWSIAPGEAVLIGDKDTDIEAARRAGIEGLLFPGGDLLAFVRAHLGDRLPPGRG